MVYYSKIEDFPPRLWLDANNDGGGWICKSCLTLCSPMNCSPTGSTVHGILQARILDWAAISHSSDWPRDWTVVSGTVGRFFTTSATWETSIMMVTFSISICLLGFVTEQWYINICLIHSVHPPRQPGIAFKDADWRRGTGPQVSCILTGRAGVWHQLSHLPPVLSPHALGGHRCEGSWERAAGTRETQHSYGF